MKSNKKALVKPSRVKVVQEVYSLRNRSIKPSSAKSVKKDQALRKKKIANTPMSIKKNNGVERSPKKTPLRSVKASPHLGSTSAIKSSYNVAQIRTMKESLMSNFGTASRTKKSRACAFRCWNDYWKELRQEPVLSAETITDFIVHGVLQGRKISGISTYLGGIGATLLDNGSIDQKEWDALISNRLVKGVKLAAARREALLGVQVKQASAITVEELKELCVNASSLSEITIAAAAVLAFFNVHRGSELYLTDRNDNSLKRPYAGDVIVSEKTVTYRIRSEKQRQFTATTLCLHAKEVPTWAFETWNRFWRQRSEGALRSHPDLFVKSKGGVITCGDMNQFLSMGHRKLTTHSLRAGGATWMLLQGATLEQVCAKGRWSSVQSLLRYLRKDPDLAELLRTITEFWGRNVLDETTS